MSARHLGAAVREGRVVAGLVTGAVVVAVLAAAMFLPSTYTSDAAFYVASAQAAPSSSDSYQGVQLAAERVASYRELITGRRVAEDASALLDGSPTPEDIRSAIGTDAVSSTVVLDVAVTAGSPAQAQAVNAAAAEAFTRLVAGIESAGQPDGRPIVTVRLVHPPSLPAGPDGPGRVLLVVLGLLAAPLLGAGAALLRRRLRGRVEDAATAEEILGVPVLGRIPRRRPGSGQLAVLSPHSTRRTDARARDLHDRIAAFGRLRNAVRGEAGVRGSLVVAPVAGAPETSFAVELAVMLAADGESVVLVDADLRQPTLHDVVGTDAGPGLADVLTRAVGLAAAVRPWPLGDVDVLTAGSPVGHPRELGARIGPVLAALGRRYRRVVVVAASVAGAADAVDLAAGADGVLVAVRRGATRPEHLEDVAADLRVVGAPVLGCVLLDALERPDEPAWTRRPPPAPRAHPPALARRAPLALPPGPSGSAARPVAQLRTASWARNQS